jgi:hypothetical protein
MKIILFTCFSLVGILNVSGAKIYTVGSYSDLVKSEKKMAFCVDVLSNGTIKRGMDYVEVLKVFQVKLSDPVNLRKESWTYVLDFENPPKIEAPSDFAVGFSGWYLCLEFDAKNKLKNYYLSNLHK